MLGMNILARASALAIGEIPTYVYVETVSYPYNYALSLTGVMHLVKN